MVSEKDADLKNRITTYPEDTKSVIQDIEDRRKEMVEMVNKTIDDLVKTVNEFESKECKKMAEYIKKLSIAVENDKITVANARKTVENTNNLLLLESDLKFEKDLHTSKLIRKESYALEKVRFEKGPTTINKKLQDFAGKLKKIKEMKNEGITQSRKTAFIVNDRVRVKNHKFEWGDGITDNSEGIVVRILSAGKMLVNFPGCKSWLAHESEVELVDAWQGTSV